MGNVRSVRLPVHGFVEFNDWERDIINHPVFQRLRRIRQLAFSEHLYPGSTHTRFEHSLGVMHVATRLYDRLRAKCERELIDVLGGDRECDRPRTLLRLAALLHDVGHAPFSHTGEDLMPQKEDGHRFAHEDYSAELIRHEMRDVIDDNQDNKHALSITAEEVADFLSGNPRTPRFLFWRELISGQLDADRMDYLLRDAHHCGVSYGHFDLDRIIDTVTLVANDHDELPLDFRVGIEEGGRHAAEGMFLARYFMFRQVYFHHVRKAYDKHASRCLQSFLEKVVGRPTLPPPDQADGRKKFLELDDWVVQQAILDKCGGSDACAILKHEHDRCVDQTQEVAKPSELRDHEERVGELRKAGLHPWVEDADKEWYKTSKELLIARKRKDNHEPAVGDPLSEKSKVMGNLLVGRMRMTFVPHEEEKKAREILKP